MKSVIKLLLYIFFFSLLLLACSPLLYSAERASNDQEVYNSCCRVYSGSYAGSGTAFAEYNNDLYILTNYHVCENRAASVQFFAEGEPTERIPAENIARGYNEQQSIDFVVLRIKATPRTRHFVPFWNDANGEPYTSGEAIIGTTGAPRAQWLRTVRGRVVSAERGKNIVFMPTPYGGQSGSSIIGYNDGLPYIIGLLTWRTDAEGAETAGGLAQPIDRIITCLTSETYATRCTAEPRQKNWRTNEYNLNTPINTGNNNEPVRKITDGDGVTKIECKSVARPIMEIYTMGAGCAPCMALEADVQDGIYNAADVIVRGTTPNVSAYPRIILKSPDGFIVRSFTGYNQDTKRAILDIIKRYTIAQEQAQTTTSERKREQVVETLAPLTPPADVGCLPFAIPKNDAPQKQVEPPATPPADEPKRGGIFGGLKNDLRGELDDLTDNMMQRAIAEGNALIKRMTLPLAFLVFVACICANLATAAAQRLVVWLWRVLTSAAAFGFDLLLCRFNKLDDAFVARIAEKLTELNNNKSKK